MFPRQSVGSVVGFGGVFGAVGSVLVTYVTAWVLQLTGSYVPIFVVAGVAYLVALAIIHAISPPSWTRRSSRGRMRLNTLAQTNPL